MSDGTESVNAHMNEPSESARLLGAPLSRRGFVTKGIAIVGLGSVLPAAFLRAAFTEHEPASASAATVNTADAADASAPARRRVLVVLQLAGGNDGLNTVVPYTDGAYYDARPRVAVNADAALHLDSAVALHPELTGLKALYDAGKLAVVQGVGYPDPNRSHFRSMEIWHTASLAEDAPTGWLGRLLDATRHEQDSLWRAANVGAEAPESLRSTASFVPSIASVPTYALQTDPAARGQASRRTTDWLQLYAHQAALGGALPFVSKTGIDAYESTVALKRSTSMYEAMAQYPGNALGTALKTAAQLIASNSGMGVCYVTTGGFDTHAAEGTTQPGLLRGVSDSVAAFQADLAGHGLEQDVITLVWTEFGRRVRENGSQGTDHGTAGPAFLVGGAVRGGLYGEQPSVRDLDGNGDLKFTTDFRSIYATVLGRWFSTDPKDVLGANFPFIPVLG